MATEVQVVEKEKDAAQVEAEPFDDIETPHSCINCGQDTVPIEREVVGRGKKKELKFTCPQCKHEWGLEEMQSPHWVNFNRR